jgi:hypothetical protein
MPNTVHVARSQLQFMTFQIGKTSLFCEYKKNLSARLAVKGFILVSSKMVGAYCTVVVLTKFLSHGSKIQIHKYSKRLQWNICNTTGDVRYIIMQWQQEAGGSDELGSSKSRKVPCSPLRLTSGRASPWPTTESVADKVLSITCQAHTYKLLYRDSEYQYGLVYTLWHPRARNRLTILWLSH